MADMGGSATPIPASSTHCPATTSSSSAAPAAVPTPAPSTHCPATASSSPAVPALAQGGGAQRGRCADEESAKVPPSPPSSARSTISTYLASSSRWRRMRPPVTSSDVAWTVEDVAIGDELRRGT
uniref:Uncharacterized protein n=1 Tax=Oryza glumipatula TaxID=40148 RepID=A0A0D9ZXL5_9ORYZ